MEKSGTSIFLKNFILSALAILAAVVLVLVGYAVGKVDTEKKVENNTSGQVEKKVETIDNNNTTSTDTTNNVTSTDTTKKGLTKQDIANYVKKDLTNSGLAKTNEIEQWTFDKVVYVGYFKNEPDKKIYQVSGKFKCVGKDNNSCVYQPQLEDPDANNVYPWALYVAVTEANWGSDIGDVGGTYEIYSPDFVTVNQELTN